MTMTERPDQQLVTEHRDEDTTLREPRPNGGLSTADIANGGTSLKPEDRPMPAAHDMASAPAADPTTPAAGVKTRSEAVPLFPAGDAEGFRARWSEIQTGFVDDPRQAVEQGDGLVAEVMKRLAETFAEERAKLEQQWDRGDNVDTENLRVALQHYRSFFDRLLSM
jgi:hypothetical protein